MTAVLDTGAGPNLVRKGYLSRAWSRNSVLIKTTCLQSAANVQQEVKVVIKLDVQLGQKVAEASFLEVTKLATNMILGTAYIA